MQIHAAIKQERHRTNSNINKHNNGLCTGVSHLGALVCHPVQNNEVKKQLNFDVFFPTAIKYSFSSGNERCIKIFRAGFKNGRHVEKIRYLLNSSIHKCFIITTAHKNINDTYIEDNTWFRGDMKFIFECSNR